MAKIKSHIKIGITLGDYNGVGPELILKVFEDNRMLGLCTPVLYGSSRVLSFYRKLGSIEKFQFQVVLDATQAQAGQLSLIECLPPGDKDKDRVEPGKPSEASGMAAFLCLKAAMKDLKEGKIDAMVTLPIDKSTIQNTEFKFPGHTEFLAAQFQNAETVMLMVHETLRVATVTGHLPLNDVASALTSEKILKKIRVLQQSLKVDFNIQKPQMAVLGLNPHAGDNGLLGKEDAEIIRPAIEKAKTEKMFVKGPYPADGFFAHGAYQHADAILATYHDQGLVPFKLIASGKGVNYTAGLPVIRTSPDHGTAYDLAGKFIVDETSTRNAIFLALDIFSTRAANLALASGALKGKVPEELMREDEVALTE
jgi:4-hydroxythreonine-4-phosphate dehydrogenase